MLEQRMRKGELVDSAWWRFCPGTVTDQAVTGSRSV